MTIAIRQAEAKTILYASYVSPFPAHSGERIRTLNLIAALRHLGYRVEALVGNFDRVDLPARNREGVRFRELPFAWPRLRQAAHIYARPDDAFVRQVQALHCARSLSAIFLDYGFMGAQIAPLRRLGIPVVLGTHNVESALTGEAPQRSFFKTAAIRLRQTVEATHERWFFPAADALLCVSEADHSVYARYIAPGRLHVIPNFQDIPDIYGGTPRLPRIIMTGSFDNFQNREGLAWFLRDIWNGELAARAEFCIAGKHSDKIAEEQALPARVTALGPRDDLLAEIAQSACAVVPILQGGGTRFKCLEAMATRTPVVTTTKGCEGIDHGGAFRIADEASQFRRAILDVLASRDAAQPSANAGRVAFDRQYGLAANAARLGRAIEAATRVHTERAAV